MMMMVVVVMMDGAVVGVVERPHERCSNVHGGVRRWRIGTVHHGHARVTVLTVRVMRMRMLMM